MYLAEDKRKLCVSVIDYCSDNRLKDFGYAPYNNPIIMHLFDVLPEPYNFKRESNFSWMTVDSITKSNIRYKLVWENLYLTATDLGGSINYYVEAYKKKVTDLWISKEP